MPHISIIIPVYNCTETIERCIDSVLKQDFSDFEVVLVNDGSTDNSLDLIRKQAERDTRIMIVNMEHAGVSAARNLALDNARGEYVCFVDSDDYVEPNYLSAMYVHRDCDMVVCGYFVDWFKADGTLVRQEKAALQQVGEFDISDGCDCIYDLFVNGKIHINCNKLLKRSIIDRHNIRYTPIPVNEDYIFMIEYLKHAKTVYATDAVTYHWQKMEGRKSGVDSMPESLLGIYVNAYQKTCTLFKEQNLVNKIFYYTFEFVARKYMMASKQGIITRSECIRLLDEMFATPEVKDCWRAHKNTTSGERVMNLLLSYRMYNIYQKLFVR